MLGNTGLSSEVWAISVAAVVGALSLGYLVSSQRKGKQLRELDEDEELDMPVRGQGHACCIGTQTNSRTLLCMSLARARSQAARTNLSRHGFCLQEAWQSTRAAVRAVGAQHAHGHAGQLFNMPCRRSTATPSACP